MFSNCKYGEMKKKYVVITGAYGGLGRALSKIFSNKTYGLILMGRKEKKLIRLKKDLHNKDDIKHVVCDIRDWKSCKKAYEKIQSFNISIDVLINNAGITYIQKFDDQYSIKKYQRVIQTNFNGPVYLTKLFFNDIVNNKGSFVTISSVLGYAPLLGRTAYVASKFGLEGFFSVLEAELNKKAHILMVYPTFIATGIRKKIKRAKTVNEVLKPDKVARTIFKAFEKKKSKVYIGKTAKLACYLYKFFPNLYVHLMRTKASL